MDVSDDSSDSSEDDHDDQSLLLVGCDSLQDEVARVKETIQRIEEGTADDFVLGCEMLLAKKQTQVTRAYANFERFKQTAIQVYEYECEQAKARYHARCEELKQEMSDELQREIQRLKNTRDGVSVMDRRRLTRNSGGGAKGFGQKRHGGHGGVSSINGAGSAISLGGLSINNGAPQQQIRPLTPGEEAYRVQFEEKKRLELLLSKTPVFKQLNQRVESEEVNNDLAAITLAVQRRSGAPFDCIMNGKGRVAFPPVSNAPVLATSKTKKTSIRVFSDDEEDSLDSCEDSDVGSYQTEADDEREDNDDADRQSLKEIRRLAFNPGMLQEGDKVVVVYHSTRNDDAVDEEMKNQEDAHKEVLHNTKLERVLSGVITASTSTRVFLLCANGRFETIDVGDWKAGHVSVHAAETHRKRKR